MIAFWYKSHYCHWLTVSSTTIPHTVYDCTTENCRKYRKSENYNWIEKSQSIYDNFHVKNGLLLIQKLCH